jgi:hypothetical protein
MARQPEGLTLDAGLIRKGEARGLHPVVAQQPPAMPAEPAPGPAGEIAPASGPPPRPRPSGQAARVVAQPPTVGPTDDGTDEPPLRAAPPEIEPLRFTSFRLPVELDELLRAMMFETRRSKQDILIGFVRDGIAAWRKQRRRAGQGP